MNSDFDRVIVKRLKSHDFLALIPLFETYRKRINHRIILHTGSDKDVEYITSATVYKVWYTRLKLDINKSLKGYLYTLAIEETQNFFHGKKICKYSKDIMTDFHESIASITPVICRKVCTMSFLEKKNEAEIASELNLTEHVVKGLLNDGRNLMKEKLKYILEL